MTTTAHPRPEIHSRRAPPASRSRHSPAGGRQWFIAAAQLRLKEHDRLALARQMMERKLVGPNGILGPNSAWFLLVSTEMEVRLHRYPSPWIAEIRSIDMMIAPDAISRDDGLNRASTTPIIS